MTSILTRLQKSRIKNLVSLHHKAFIVEMFGDSAIDKSSLRKLKSSGMYRKPGPDAIRRALEFGKVGINLPKVLNMTNKKFEKFMAGKGMILTAREQLIIKGIRAACADHFQNISDFAQERIDEAIAKSDKVLQKELEDKQRKELLTELARRKALAKLAKSMHAATKSVVGNASRVISTETNNAYQSGRAMEIYKSAKRAGIDDPKVFKRPQPDACPECNKAYLEDDGVTPKVFTMSELASNDTNIGKSKDARLPVIESHHPWCACELFWLPNGFGFDSNGSLTYVGRKP